MYIQDKSILFLWNFNFTKVKIHKYVLHNHKKQYILYESLNDKKKTLHKYPINILHKQFVKKIKKN